MRKGLRNYSVQSLRKERETRLGVGVGQGADKAGECKAIGRSVSRGKE